MAENNNYSDQEAKTKVIQGVAQVDKPTIGKKMVNFLFSDKIDSVANYLTYYILGPSLKDLVFKMATGGLQMVLFGGQNNSQPPYQGYNGYYNNYNYNNNGYLQARRDQPYNGYQGSGFGYAQPQPGIYNPSRISLNDISFDSKDDAWTVLDRMSREIGRYGKVRVADFYTFAGITGQEDNWTLQANGWYDLNAAHPLMRTDGRWIIEFPPVQTIR